MGAKSALWPFRLVATIAPAATTAALFLAAPALAAPSASTFSVSGFGDGTGSCTAPGANGASVCSTLRAAVNQANTQSNLPTIMLSAGSYQLNLASGGQLDLASSMNIVGTGPDASGGTTIQQTDGQNRVLRVDGSTRLTGLEITGGHLAPPWSSSGVAKGGGILVMGTLQMNGVLVTGNQAVGGSDSSSSGNPGDEAQGGGIDFPPGAPAGSTITNSTITGNSAIGGKGGNSVGTGAGAGGLGRGGGINYEGTGPLQLSNTTLSGNQATGGSGGSKAGAGGGGGGGWGGAIFDAGGLTAQADTFSANTATGGSSGGSGAAGASGIGGGIYTLEVSDRIVNSTFFGNRSAGGAAQGGTPGTGYGGGLEISGSAAALSLAGDTFDANQADQAGNLYVYVGGVDPPYPFTIHDTILTGGSPNNCQINSAASSESYNLEDDAAGQCGFKAANHDLVGANPQLQSGPAANGGPTSTLAPAPGSPVMAAGGQCLDPTSSPANQPLTVDQRGQPRPNPCDIGAFQSQPPRNTAPPVVSGRPLLAQTLSCGPGTWSGDGPLSFAYQWLRDGGAITGTASSTYLTTPGDVGHRIACAVTAAHYGSATATSGSISVVPTAVTLMLKVTVSGRVMVIRLGCQGATGEVCGGLLTAATVETIKAGRPVAISARVRLRRLTHVIALRGYTIVAGGTATLRIGLDGPGARLLKRFGRLPVRLTLTQFTASGTKTVASRRVTVRPQRPKRRKHRS